MQGSVKFRRWDVGGRSNRLPTGLGPDLGEGIGFLRELGLGLGVSVPI